MPLKSACKAELFLGSSLNADERNINSAGIGDIFFSFRQYAVSALAVEQ